MPFGIDFWKDCGVDFGCQNEAKLIPKWDQKSMLTSKGDFCKIELSLQRGLDFLCFGGLSWERKSTKNRFKREVQDTMHPGIVFH